MGFYNNVGIDLNGEIRKALEDGFQDSIKNSSTIFKSVVPEPAVEITKNDHLILKSLTYPDIVYDVDLSNIFNKIYDKIKSSFYNNHIDITTIKSDDFSINSPYRANYPFIKTDIIFSKGEILISIRGDKSEPILGCHKYGSVLPAVFSDFNDKVGIEVDIKESPVRICMDLRNYITQSLNGLSKGKLTPIQVKTGIEEYIKRLK